MLVYTIRLRTCYGDPFLQSALQIHLEISTLVILHSPSVFVQYMSIGYELGKVPLTYDHLKLIQLYQVSFEDMKEILVVLRLILSSPNLQELHISVSCA